MQTKTIELKITGLGIIFYSPSATAHIQEHEDYFAAQYNDGAQVLRHIQEGSIVGFSTGSGGTYILKILTGYPSKAMFDQHEFKIRLGIKVQDETVIFRDLYDMMDWRATVSPHQSVKFENGFYHVTLCTNVPSSGVLGDNQEVLVYFQVLKTMPELKYAGVPILCD